MSQALVYHLSKRVSTITYSYGRNTTSIGDSRLCLFDADSQQIVHMRSPSISCQIGQIALLAPQIPPNTNPYWNLILKKVLFVAIPSWEYST